MSFTVPPPPLAIADHFPDLVPHARSTTLLYPRAGAPGRCESSLGGPLLWPADEPWPTCAAPDHYNPARGRAVVGPPGWTQAPRWPECVCGERMEHLLTISASESCGRWLPVEERTRPGSGWEVSDARQDDSHGMVMGDAGGVYVFVCRACPNWPTIHRYDC